MPATTFTLETMRSRLAAIGQEQVLAFADSLDAEKLDHLLGQLAALDLDAIPELVAAYVTTKPEPHLPADIQPAPYYPSNPTAEFRPWDADHFRAVGEGLLRAGKVACFTVAGGQGTRLGFDGPKGCYPAGAVTGRPLFQFFAEAIAKTGEKYGKTPPWYIMTSPLNHDATVAYLAKHDHFGLDPEAVMLFPQGVMPSFDMQTGKMLLAEPHALATNPDGHGGSLRALKVSGALADMQARSIEYLSYFQVDNPIVRVADPVFLGLHAAAPDSSGEMSSKMLAKVAPEEKLGMFCVADGTLQIIEYSDLPMDLQRERLADGRLRFLAGSPAIHLLSVAFLDKLNSDPKFALPYHRAEKKVACVDPATGERIVPGVPNAVKLERFVFDAMPLAARSIVYEANRTDEFAPIKNAEGTDSPQTSRDIQTRRAAGWLEAAGVAVPRGGDGEPDCTIELSPRTAVDSRDIDGATVGPIAPKAEVVV
ncbi:MAG: UTP--glucose-1-phosphate uridylyltransferase [Planctomycetota bacterium]|nr:UTP--glucose-1-phosphate uridylyltransferase [Planctomycetota bacterium]